MIGTDCIGSFKPNYYTLMTTTAPTIADKLLKVILNPSPYVNYKKNVWWDLVVGTDVWWDLVVGTDVNMKGT